MLSVKAFMFVLFIRFDTTLQLSVYKQEQQLKTITNVFVQLESSVCLDSAFFTGWSSSYRNFLF